MGGQDKTGRRSDELSPRAPTIGGYLAVATALALLFAPSLGPLWDLASRNELAASADAYTHFWRVQLAKEYFLPSGHHWGWDPFWFQGFSPFLLYPHLMYVVLAAADTILPISSSRLMNLFTVATLFAPALVVALPALRRFGLQAAILVAIWIGAADSVYGAGIRGLFGMGLLTQQVGLAVFAGFAYQLLVARRVEHAALWLGLAALVHLHTAIIAAVCWILFTPFLVAADGDRSGRLRSLAIGSVVATTIAAPTLVGLLHGFDQVGGSTGFGNPDTVSLLVRGTLLGPFPMLIAVSGLVLAAARPTLPTSAVSPKTGPPITGPPITGCPVTGSPEIGTPRTAPTGTEGMKAGAFGNVALGALVVGVVLIAVSVQRMDLEPAFVHRLFRFVLRLRTGPYAYIWLAIGALAAFPTTGLKVRRLVWILTAAGCVATWVLQGPAVARINALPVNADAQSARVAASFEETAAWVEASLDGRTATMALVAKPKPPLRFATQQLVERLRMPVLGGHGVELSPVRNVDLINRYEKLTCEEIRTQLARYAVGYLVVHNTSTQKRFADCFGRAPDFARGPWAVFRTAWDWASFHPSVDGFEGNKTWTRLTWMVRPSAKDTTLVLPVAATAPWRATAFGSHSTNSYSGNERRHRAGSDGRSNDAKPVGIDATTLAISPSKDGLLKVTLPPGTQELRLEYRSFPGEWISVVLSALALLSGAVAFRRRGRHQER